ncbi:MAG: Multidrug resistance protein MdtA precursor [Betaproteobacteria bacterium ADurb.Bin341]|nr:MAG: Multidrug resistance protein MdtA precursor [Betaproteobacteria bacterium ADurb.Bin341]
MDWHSARETRFAHRQRGRIAIIGVALLALLAALWFWFGRGTPTKPMGQGAIPVQTTVVSRMDVPVLLVANGKVAALQSVEVRAQISATIKAVHIREGQEVRQGDRLFSLDVRSERANLSKSAAQAAKSRADLANAERNLSRQRELFRQNFISQTALDATQNQVDSLRAQVAADRAAVEASRVAVSFGEIIAPIAGRTGAISVYPGSLVQPNGSALVSITQIDPIHIVFTLPEREFPALREAFGQGELAVRAHLGEDGETTLAGHLAFIDNSVDSASGTIRLKASFANPDGRLWPGMFARVSLSPRTLKNALAVPVQAVQTGPEHKFVYAVGADAKVSAQTVRVLLVQEGRAFIEGVDAGTKVVVEGAQNLKPGSTISEGNGGKQPAAQKRDPK